MKIVTYDNVSLEEALTFYYRAIKEAKINIRNKDADEIEKIIRVELAKGNVQLKNILEAVELDLSTACLVRNYFKELGDFYTKNTYFFGNTNDENVLATQQISTLFFTIAEKYNFSYKVIKHASKQIADIFYQIDLKTQNALSNAAREIQKEILNKYPEDLTVEEMNKFLKGANEKRALDPELN